MKHIIESIIGKRGSGFHSYKGYLSYGDIVRVSKGVLLMYMEEKDARRFAGERFSAFVSLEYAISAAEYDEMLKNTSSVGNSEIWNITHIFKTSGRFPIESYRQEELEEMVKNCGTCITLSKNIK